MEYEFKIKTVEGLTDELFFDLCQANSELRMERDQHGNIIVISPTGANTGNYNSELNYEITHWNRQTRLGYVFDSSAGFTFPNGAVRSPDSSWIYKDRWESLSQNEQEKFAPICPDFMVEVRSKIDRLSDLQTKMEEYRSNGCRLGWLVDRQGKAVYIYRADGSTKTIKGETVSLDGEDVLPGFVLELSF
jgi:Uma2 family endonuclease